MRTDHKSEAETRAGRIDVELSSAGWSSSRRNLVEEYVLRTGEPDAPGEREQFADYVLLGSDGKPLAVVEAKRSSRDAYVGKRQASDYAGRL
jgi:type I restriction enzyme R subunit